MSFSRATLRPLPTHIAQLSEKTITSESSEQPARSHSGQKGFLHKRRLVSIRHNFIKKSLVLSLL
jgi:hypothetical protein